MSSIHSAFVALGLVLAAGTARAIDIAPYSPAMLATAQTQGEPVAVHFHADWCPTCRLQEKVLQGFRAEPGLNMKVLVADYDRERELKQKLGVRVQSTLVVFRGGTETARLAGNTDPAELRMALQTAIVSAKP